jgi:hypothetical protein
MPLLSEERLITVVVLIKLFTRIITLNSKNTIKHMFLVVFLFISRFYIFAIK